MGVIVSFIYDKTKLNLFINSFRKLRDLAIKMLSKSIQRRFFKPSSALQVRLSSDHSFAPHKYEGASVEETLSRRRKNFSKGLALYYKG